MIIVRDKILHVDENNSHYSNKRMVLHMVAAFIICTVVAYSFVMKHVLSRVLKPQDHSI